MKEKRLDFELLRILAILLVIYNHTGTNGFSMFTQSCGRLSYVFTLALAIVCKIGVPLFFMISGGLLLDREEPVRVILKKRVLRVLIALVVFSGINYLMRIYWGTITEPTFHDFLTRLWSEGMTDPYWYLYTYLGFLLLLPMLRPMVQHMTDRAFMYLILLNLVFVGIVPTVGYMLGLGKLHEDFWIPLVIKTGIYFLLGYYAMHRVDLRRVTGRFLAGLWAAAAAAVLLTAVLMTWDREQLWSYFERFTLWPTLAVYFTAAVLVQKHPMGERCSRVLSELGGCVFGTFLMEGMLRYELTPLFQFLRPRIHVLPACAVFVLAVTASGMLISFLLRRLPGVKKLL